jgi:NAD+ synthase (glutamine-hydrolysing)
MRIALAQINPTLGDFKSNAEKIIEFIQRAASKRADLVVFSELSLFGYAPNDALERPDLVPQQEVYIKKIAAAIPKGITVIYGAIISNPKPLKVPGKPYQNVAVVAESKKPSKFFAKQCLPSYDIFDEARFFEPGTETGVVKIPKIGRVAISVCEDMWSNTTEIRRKIYRNVFSKIKNVDLIVNISSSPFSRDKMKWRLDEAREHVKKIKAPFVYVNQVGGQDELIYDGRSFILDQKGKIIVQAAPCDEDLVIIDLKNHLSEYRPQDEDPAETLRKVLVLGLRDFVRKTNQKAVHLGLSGGIDSAVVASLAVDAFGPGKVTGFLLPGPYSSEGSITDSEALAKNLGIKTHKIDINRLYNATVLATGDFPNETGSNLMEQNIQARVRANIMMAFSNRTQSMLLCTSNKSELASGYSTLYGDLTGGLLPIGDLTKNQVYALAKLYNQGREIIPQSIIDKAPSAELAPNQKDQDTLPPYDLLDKAVVNIVEEQKVAKTETEKWLLQALAKSEFKRWQSPPILRVSAHGFGRGRRMPISLKLN